MAPSSRVETLDILRGLMALAVAIYHLSNWTALFPAGSLWNNVLAVTGNYGVEGFFIISGFCFFYIYRDTQWGWGALRAFHIKRFFRIAPLYYLAVALNLALRQTAGPDPTTRMLAENFTLTFGLFHPNHALVLGGWSIGIEYVFYFAFPLLAWGTRRKEFLYLGAAALIALAVPWSFGKVQAATFVGNAKFHTYVQIPNHAFLFFLGGIAAHLRSLTLRRLPGYAFLILGLLVVGLGWWLTPRFYDHFIVMEGFLRARLTGLSVLVVVLFAFYDLNKGDRLRVRWCKGLFLHLGDWSYSVYLMHPFAILALERLLPASVAPHWKFLGGLGLTLALAALTHRWVEKPAMALGRTLANGPKPCQNPPPQA